MNPRRLLGAVAGLGVAAAAAALGSATAGAAYRRIVPSIAESRDGLRGSARPREVLHIPTVDDLRLWAGAWGGDGPALVFCHGLCLSHALWRDQLEAFGAGDRLVVAYDARGHGRSDPIPVRGRSARLTTSDLVGDLRAVLGVLGDRPTILVGHSMGGLTALALAASELPRSVRGLVLVNSTFTGRVHLRGARGRAADVLTRVTERLAPPPLIDVVRLPPGDLGMIVTRLGMGIGVGDEQVRRVRDMIAATPLETLPAAIGLADVDLHDDLWRVDVPTLVVSGSRDLIAAPRISERLAKSIPGADLIEFAGAGHMVPIECSGAFNAALQSFVDRVDA